MKDRTKEKEELYRKVLGKDAPKRNLTAADLEIKKKMIHLMVLTWTNSLKS